MQYLGNLQFNWSIYFACVNSLAYRMWVNISPLCLIAESHFTRFTIGRGVKASEDFQKKDFLLDYKGECISEKEGLRRLDQYESSIGSFLYFFEDAGCRKW